MTTTGIVYIQQEQQDANATNVLTLNGEGQ